MTVADMIRNMSDLELADFLSTMLSERDHVMSEKLANQGVPNSLIEMPQLSILHTLKFLQGPAGDVFEVEE